MIKEKFQNKNLSFETITKDTVVNAMRNLPTSLANFPNNIPNPIVTETVDAYCPKLTQIVNDYLKNSFS